MVRAGAVILSVLLAAAAPAAAAPCELALGRRFTGPVELGVREAGLGAPRSPCRERSIFARLAGGATIDPPDFYGTLAATTQLGVRWPIAWLGGLELSADAFLVDARFAQNASLKATELSYGPFALGVLWAGRFRLLGVPVAFAPALRVIAPGSRVGVEGDRGGAELALHLGLRPRRWLSLDAHASALAWLFEGKGGGTDHFAQASFAAGAGLVLADWLAVLAGAEIATGWYDNGVDHVLVRGGLRFTSRRAGAFDLGVVAPVAGSERADLLVLLGWSRGL